MRLRRCAKYPYTWRAGEQVAIIGSSGAGKTTLLHILACALRPATGSMQLNEANPWAVNAARLKLLRGPLFLAPQVPPLPPRQRAVTAVLAGLLPHLTFLGKPKKFVLSKQYCAGRFSLITL